MPKTAPTLISLVVALNVVGCSGFITLTPARAGGEACGVVFDAPRGS